MSRRLFVLSIPLSAMVIFGMVAFTVKGPKADDSGERRFTKAIPAQGAVKAPADSEAAGARPTGSRAVAKVQILKPVAAADGEPLAAIPTLEELFEDLEIEINVQKIELGRRLFHDTRLSSDDSLSCASCHDLRYGGIDRATSATGVNGQIGPINTPTVFNAVFGISQFWDGRAASLENQADGPPNAKGEMASNWKQILAKLGADGRMLDAFKTAYPEVKSATDLKAEHALSAIADFERTLITPGSRFDEYLDGDLKAITAEEYTGYKLFKDIGCVQCHYGASVGSKAFQPLGAKKQYFTTDAHFSEVDLGRFNVTKSERDRFVFKVPSLRNIDLTGPYFHDGSKKSLDDAVRAMAFYQLDKDLSDDETRLIVAFLKTLTGDWSGKPLDEHQNRK